MFVGCWFQVCLIHLLRWPSMVRASVIRQNHARIHWTQNGTSTLTCGSIFLLVSLSVSVHVCGWCRNWLLALNLAGLHTATAFWPLCCLYITNACKGSSIFTMLSFTHLYILSVCHRITKIMLCRWFFWKTVRPLYNEECLDFGMIWLASVRVSLNSLNASYI